MPSQGLGGVKTVWREGVFSGFLVVFSKWLFKEFRLFGEFLVFFGGFC